MKCPKCNKEGARYKQKLSRTPPPGNEPIQRVDFQAKHSCGWDGYLK